MSISDVADSGLGTASTLGRGAQKTTSSEPNTQRSQAQPSNGEPQLCDGTKGVCSRINFASLSVGMTDPIFGVKIKEILLVTDHSIVYIDHLFSLQWHCCSDTLTAKVAAPIFNRAGDLEAKAQFLRHVKKPREDHKKSPEEEEKSLEGLTIPRDLLSALRLIGQGVVELFSTKDPNYANAALDTADKFITQRAREISRRWYFSPFLGFFTISALVVLVSYIFDPSMAKKLAIVCTFAGGLGSFISRALDNQNTPISATAGRTLHWIEATLRWCTGLTAGLLVWLLVTGNIAGSFLNTNAAQNTFAIIAIAILAGASERLLPSLIRNFDESIDKNGLKPQPNSNIAQQ
jgi:hypothetical protein